MINKDYKYGDLVHYSITKSHREFAIFICDRAEKSNAIL